QTQFIYSFSRRHVMNIMFNSHSRPFYHSTINMGLDVIPMDVYTEFAERMFDMYGFVVNDDLVEKVYKNFNGCTWYLQMMMNELFTLTDENGVCDIEKYDTALRNIIQVQKWTYEDILAQLPTVKKQVLIAIAKAGNAAKITSADFIESYALRSASSVQSAMKSLLERDLVTAANGIYRVTDYFFAEWIRNEF
ncbi:MAG: ATPase, partial [Bacteroidales bacterium]|nr:ATPase [Bacteroidales bacterium]